MAQFGRHDGALGRNDRHHRSEDHHEEEKNLLSLNYNLSYNLEHVRFYLILI